jgi:hypothetical protein
MSAVSSLSTLASIIDNQGENTLLHALEKRTENGQELAIATAFFSLDALSLLGQRLKSYDRVRLLFGDEASALERDRCGFGLGPAQAARSGCHIERVGIGEGEPNPLASS